ncbi:MAG: (Fe-S)-binding protein, partial [Deltaproteobacteria bacterium]
MADLPKSDELIQINHNPPKTGWMDTPTVIRKGIYCYAANYKSVETLSLPNAREWNPLDADWKLPQNWKEIIHNGFKERLDKYRSFKIFMDVCVRCGACADKCQFYLGTGDPRNMPVARAELLRQVYRRYYTLAGRFFPDLNDAADFDEEMLAQWYTYFYQCSECRRCS